MARVLMGDFAAMVRAGLEAILADEQADVVRADGRDLLTTVAQALPRVVVLDADRAGTDGLARQLCTRFPAVTVVACSSARPMMRVFPPFHRGESYTRRLDVGELHDLLRG